jgi:hypothetical protein
MFETFVRIGKCKGRGHCCSFSTTWAAEQNLKMFSYNSSFRSVVLNECCKEFDRKTCKCKVHESQPHICKVFPLHPQHMIICSDDCGYSFIPINVEMVDL